MSASASPAAPPGATSSSSSAGGYHGHCDGLLVEAGSGVATLAHPGQRRRPGARPPRPTIVVPYNDLGRGRGRLRSPPRPDRRVIVEPVAANAGVLPPGAGLPRAAPRAHRRRRRAPHLRRGHHRLPRRPRRRPGPLRGPARPDRRSARSSAAGCRSARTAAGATSWTWSPRPARSTRPAPSRATRWRWPPGRRRCACCGPSATTSSRRRAPASRPGLRAAAADGRRARRDHPGRLAPDGLLPRRRPGDDRGGVQRVRSGRLRPLLRGDARRRRPPRAVAVRGLVRLPRPRAGRACRDRSRPPRRPSRRVDGRPVIAGPEPAADGPRRSPVADPRADALPARLPARAGRRDPGLVHAPGRPGAPRVPGHPRAGHARRDHPRRRPLRRGHPPAGPPARRRRGDPVRRHHDAASPASGVDFEIVEGRRPGHRDADPLRRRRRPPPALRARPRRSAPSSRPSGSSGASRRSRSSASPGAPFTLACYLVEGGPSREFLRTKTFMHAEPAAWAALMDALAEMTIRYLGAQVAAGAQAVQVFDSWVGGLCAARLRAARRARGWPASSTALPAARRAARPTSGSGRPASCASRPRPAATSSASTGGSPSPRAGPSSATAPSRATSTRRSSSARSRPSPTPRDWILDAAGRPPGPRLQPRARRPARAPTPTPSRRLVDLVHDHVPGRSARMTVDAVLLMAYGSPDRLDQVEAYYTDIRRGQPAPARAPRGAPRALPGDRRRLAALADRRGAAGRRGGASSPAAAARSAVYAGMRHIEPRIGTDRRGDGGRRRDRASWRSPSPRSAPRTPPATGGRWTPRWPAWATRRPR